MNRIEIFKKKLTGEYALNAKFQAFQRIIIAESTKILPHVLINANAGRVAIGKRCYIDRNVIISCHGGDINIGDHCSFNPFCVIYGHGGLTIGNDVRVATGVVIVPANHGFQDKTKKINEQTINAQGISIGDDCWIGAGAVILDGVSIGFGCVVGAGSIVTKSVEPFRIVAGNPAKVIGKR